MSTGKKSKEKKRRFIKRIRKVIKGDRERDEQEINKFQKKFS